MRERKSERKSKEVEGCVHIYQINSFIPDLFKSDGSLVPSHGEGTQKRLKNSAAN